MSKRTHEERIAHIEAQLARAKASLANVCEACSGTGKQEDQEYGMVDCSACDGGGEKLPEVEPTVEANPPTPICPRCAADLLFDGAGMSCSECDWAPTARMIESEAIAPFQEMADRVHTANHKWWIDLTTGQPLERNVGELLMLVVTELSEAVEGHRKSLPDDKLPHRQMFEVELADAVIRLLDIAGGLKLEFSNIQVVRPLSTNVAEALLRITSYVVNAYDDRESHIDLSYWVEYTILSIESLAVMHALDLWTAYEEKMQYNSVRHDHTIEARLAADGKKY